MNRKLVIIILSLVTVLVITVLVVLSINGSETSKPVAVKSSDNDVYIGKGIEKLAEIAKPAVENYATQDISESLSSRKKRLSNYFSTDSPVYNYSLEIQSTNSAIKTTAKAKSIVLSEAEGVYPCLIVKTDITNYYGDNKSTSSQTYWITIKKDSDGSFVAEDIGIWLE
jgi:flagellar basal body-associated protein FliL